MPGKLCFFSEYGYGGMNDLKSVLADYGPNPRTHMEDYAGHVVLKERRDKAFAESAVLRQMFGDLAKLREVCQEVQADTVRLHSEAMRSNPVCGGYNYVQVFDSNAIEIDGLVDFWRNKRKKAFYAMQEVNRPLLLVIRCTPMNGRAGGEVEVRVSLVNEEQVSGEKRLTVQMKTPAGEDVFSKELMVEAKPWVSAVFQEKIKVSGETGRYPVDAVLWEGQRALLRKRDFCTMFAEADLKWPSRRVVLFDVDHQLEPYLKGRGVEYEKPWEGVERPAVILVTSFTAIWQRPEEFRRYMEFFGWVERGCTAIFLGVPEDGPSLVTAANIGRGTFLSAFARETIFPFRRLETTGDDLGGQRIGPYSWGLTDPMAGVPILHHTLFEGIPQDGIMGREYGNVVPVQLIQTDWRTSEDTGTAVQIYSYGKGKIILTSLNLVPNLRLDALAEKLLCNVVKYADGGLPSELGSGSPATAESSRFEDLNYRDCLTKFFTKQKDVPSRLD
jgi:hypothetical protein